MFNVHEGNIAVINTPPQVGRKRGGMFFGPAVRIYVAFCTVMGESNEVFCLASLPAQAKRIFFFFFFFDFLICSFYSCPSLSFLFYLHLQKNKKKYVPCFAVSCAFPPFSP